MIDINFKRATKADKEAIQLAGSALFDNEIIGLEYDAFIESPCHLLMLAFFKQKIIGFVTGVIIIQPDKPKELFINEIGVLSDFRRQGIARHLINEINKESLFLGCNESWVLADEENLPANILYTNSKGVKYQKNINMYTIKHD